MSIKERQPASPRCGFRNRSMYSDLSLQSDKYVLKKAPKFSFL